MKKILFIFFGLVVLLGTFFTWQYAGFHDGKLHIVFCNIGQGDAIYIRTPGGSNVLVDSGPDRTVMDCLSRHMPFWDRHFAFVILTHPHADHLNGFVTVVDSYDISIFVTEPLDNTTVGYKKLLQLLDEHHIPVKRLIAGDRLKNNEISFAFVGPLAKFLSDTSPHGTIGETEEFASLETYITYGKFHALLTGDSQAQEIEEAIGSLPQLDLLQVPHHGSKTGLSEAIVSHVLPRLAVISVGAHNKYGHPHQQALDVLQKFGIPVKRTDRDRDVEIVTSGT